MNNKEKTLVIVVKSDYQLLNAIVSKEKKNATYQEIIIHYSGYWSSNSMLKSCVEREGTIFIGDIKSIITYLGKRTVDIISARYDPLLHFKLKVDKYICIDDGLGSYANFSHLYKAALREKNNLKIKILYPIYWVMTNTMFKMGLYEKDHVYINGTIDIEYKRIAIDLLSFIANKSKVKTLSLEKQNRSLFCTQPYIELGIFSDDEYTNFLGKVRSYLGKDFLILRHPGDKAFDYNSYDVVECYMFEVFMSKNKQYIDSVISVNSTCLLTASSIFEIKSISFKNENAKGLDSSSSSRINFLWNKYVSGVNI
jgi:hypothetical protein